MSLEYVGKHTQKGEMIPIHYNFQFLKSTNKISTEKKEKHYVLQEFLQK
jgi:hypothetical protein